MEDDKKDHLPALQTHRSRHLHGDTKSRDQPSPPTLCRGTGRHVFSHGRPCRLRHTCVRLSLGIHGQTQITLTLRHKATRITRGRCMRVNTVLQADIWTGKHRETGNKTYTAARASRLTGMKCTDKRQAAGSIKKWACACAHTHTHTHTHLDFIACLPPNPYSCLKGRNHLCPWSIPTHTHLPSSCPRQQVTGSPNPGRPPGGGGSGPSCFCCRHCLT